ncbi:hypothetical protein WDU94_003444 [Cyamophila willieti]
MGKNKTRQNVFKVAGSRSLKAKNKAKAVTVQLKKATKNIVQSRTEEINRQLASLNEVVRQSVPEPKKIIANLVEKEEKSKQEIVEKYEQEVRKEEETLDELANFNVGTEGEH